MTRLTNAANQWVKKRIKTLRALRGNKCEVRGCKAKTKLQFCHVRKTVLTASGPRGRKEKCADIAKHPRSYKLWCAKHHKLKSKKAHGSLIKKAKG